MASDVNELQRALDRINRLSSREHSGASDRKRTLFSIQNIITLAFKADPPEPRERGSR